MEVQSFESPSRIVLMRNGHGGSTKTISLSRWILFLPSTNTIAIAMQPKRRPRYFRRERSPFGCSSEAPGSCGSWHLQLATKQPRTTTTTTKKKNRVKNKKNSSKKKRNKKIRHLSYIVMKLGSIVSASIVDDCHDERALPSYYSRMMNVRSTKFHQPKYWIMAVQKSYDSIELCFDHKT